MDVLEHWTPTINWGGFAQSGMSDRMWKAFKDLVQLCHCFEHWREAHRALSLTRAPAPYYKPETRHAKQKRIDEWKRPIREAEGHMHRAAHLADEKVAEISYLVNPPDEGTPDWKIYWAAALSIGRSLGHQRARYKCLAIDSFDAAQLAESNPRDIAQRWLTAAGYTEAQPML
jgi:hypothetical protein